MPERPQNSKMPFSFACVFADRVCKTPAGQPLRLSAMYTTKKLYGILLTNISKYDILYIAVRYIAVKLNGGSGPWISILKKFMCL